MYLVGMYIYHWPLFIYSFCFLLFAPLCILSFFRNFFVCLCFSLFFPSIFMSVSLTMLTIWLLGMTVHSSNYATALWDVGGICVDCIRWDAREIIRISISAYLSCSFSSVADDTTPDLKWNLSLFLFCTNQIRHSKPSVTLVSFSQ